MILWICCLKPWFVLPRPMSPLFPSHEYISFHSSANTAQLFLPKLQVIMETCCNVIDLLKSQNIFSAKPGLRAWLLIGWAATSVLSFFWWCLSAIFFLLKHLQYYIKSKVTWAAVSCLGCLGLTEIYFIVIYTTCPTSYGGKNISFHG